MAAAVCSTTTHSALSIHDCQRQATSIVISCQLELFAQLPRCVIEGPSSRHSRNDYLHVIVLFEAGRKSFKLLTK